MIYRTIYYLPYTPKKKIDYIFLLYLYGISLKDASGQAIVSFSSLSDLVNQINNKYGTEKKVISYATIRRILIDRLDEYVEFLYYDREKNILYLHNRFARLKNIPYIRLIPQIYDLLIQKRDNLLAKYIIYIIHSCGIGHNDFTINQFLSEFDYSISSNNYKSLISEFNKLLCAENIIKIESRYEDGNKKRNTYSLLNFEYCKNKNI